MGDFIYDGLNMLFGENNMVADLTGYMSKLFDSIQKVLSNGIMDAFYGIFAGLAVSILIICFYFDMLTQATREMLTMEKLIQSFLKVMLAFTLLLCLKDIVTELSSFGQILMENVSSDTIKTKFDKAQSIDITFNFDGKVYETFPEWVDVQEAFEEQYEGAFNFSGVSIYITLLIPSLILSLAKGAGYLACTSTAILFVVRCLMSPIAIVQCFNDGMRSTGITYLKKLAALSITMAVMITIMMATTSISGNLLIGEFKNIGISEVTFDNITEVVSFKNIALLVLPTLVTIASIMGATKISYDIFGVH